MGLYASFDVIGDFGFLEETEEWGIRPDYGPGCEVFVETFIGVATSLVPVDTGYLQSSINASGGDTFCECEATAEYAQYVEYGTWKMAAQPYFTPALEEALAAAEPLWIQAEEEALLEEEMLNEELEEEMERMQRDDRDGNGSSSFGSFMGTLLATFIVALIITTIQAIFGHDFTRGGGGSSSNRRSDGEGGAVFMPGIMIT